MGALMLPSVSRGHVCFAQRDREGTYRAVDPKEVQPRMGFVEFYVSDRGAEMMRSEVENPMAECGQRSGYLTVVTGAWNISQWIPRLGAKVPENVLARMREQSGSGEAEGRAENGDGTTTARSSGIKVAAAPKEPAQKKEKRIMKGTKSGKPIHETWGAYFLENEQRVKEGKKPWTDAQLIEKMEAEFPDAKGKSTLNRPRMYRSNWNDAKHTYAKGGGRAKNEPVSRAYDEKGSPIEKGQRLSEAAKAEQPAKSKDTISIAEHERKNKAAKKGAKKGAKKVARRVIRRKK